MADHLDAPGFKSPNLNAKIDITDIFVFQKPGDSGKSVLILNVNPMAPTLATEFDDQAIYELKVDTNRDAVEEITFQFKFSPFAQGRQTVNLFKATGRHAREIRPSGEVLFENVPVCFGQEVQVVTNQDYRFYVGMRSDPFFFDLQGYLDGGKFTGTDLFIDKNVFSIVLEVPNQALGTNSQVAIWGRVLVPEGHNGYEKGRQPATALEVEPKLVQIDQMGRPLTNIIFTKDEDKNLFNRTLPAQQASLFADKFVAVLQESGRGQAEAEALVEQLLPDVLRYDYSSSAGFPNGRNLTDDIVNIVLSMVKNTPVSDKVGPHTDLLANFPYLGNPH
jgi:hypothetical protein